MISIASEAWCRTLPRLCDPLPDEWLPGLLLRCDLINGWTSGRTSRMILEASVGNIWSLIPFLSAQRYDLAKLSVLLGVPEERLLATTWRQELQRYYGSANMPLDKVSLPLRICPVCIGEQYLLHKHLAFPEVTWCCVHGLKLQHRCTCGAQLRMWGIDVFPFRCGYCDQPWSELPRQEGDTTVVAEQAEYLTCYRVALQYSSPYLAEHGLVCLVDRFLATGAHPQTQAFFPVPLTTFYRDWLLGGSLPFLRFMHACLSVGLTAHELEQLAAPCATFLQRCPNYACPRFGQYGKSNIQPYVQISRIPHWYCRSCGSVFTENRLVATFDPDCQPPAGEGVYPIPRELRAHYEQWKRWQGHILVAMFSHDQWSAPLPTKKALWEKAHIPDHPRYASPHLGLTPTSYLNQRRKLRQ